MLAGTKSEVFRIMINRIKRFLLFFLIVVNILFLITPAILYRFNIIIDQLYSIDNFRYTVSALLQSLAAVFAFIASSTILLMQLSGDSSPSSLRFFPKNRLILLLVFLLIVIIFDVSILLFLQNQINIIYFVFILTIAALNILGLEAVIYYVISIVNWLKPEKIFDTLKKKATVSHNDSDQVNIIASYEELIIKCINKGYCHNVKSAFISFEEITDIFIQNWSTLNSDELVEDPEHPICCIPGSIKRITLCLCKSQMFDMINYAGSILGKVATFGSKKSNRGLFVVEVQDASEGIVKECLEKKLESPAYNFINSLIDSVSANCDLFDVCWMLSILVGVSINYSNGYIVISEILKGLIKLSGKDNKMLEIYSKELLLLLKKDTALLSKKGWFKELTIKQQINLLEKAFSTRPIEADKKLIE